MTKKKKLKKLIRKLEKRNSSLQKRNSELLAEKYILIMDPDSYESYEIQLSYRLELDLEDMWWAGDASDKTTTKGFWAQLDS